MRSALQTVIAAGSGPVGADEACEALAACEVVARLNGNWGVQDAYTETVDAWVAAHPSVPAAEIVSAATMAIDRVLSPESELADLWGESPDKDRWRAAVANLRARVTA